MIHAKDGTEVLDNLKAVNSPGTGIEHWGSSYFGPRYSTAEIAAGPQALMTQMSPSETILPHFHGVAQFQIFPSGAGMMAKTEVWRKKARLFPHGRWCLLSATRTHSKSRQAAPGSRPS